MVGCGGGGREGCKFIRHYIYIIFVLGEVGAGVGGWFLCGRVAWVGWGWVCWERTMEMELLPVI